MLKKICDTIVFFSRFWLYNRFVVRQFYGRKDFWYTLEDLS